MQHLSRRRPSNDSPKGVLLRLARRDVVPFAMSLLRPAPERRQRQIGAVAADGSQAIQRPRGLFIGVVAVAMVVSVCAAALKVTAMRVVLFATLIASPLAAKEAVVPTASTAQAPICTDRPTKSNFACTVPKGFLQIEADGFTWLTNSSGGTRSDQLWFANPTFKYGLSASSDIQINWVPFTRIRSRDAGGRVSNLSGTGDATLRFKQRLSSADGAFQLAILPFVKLPTARAGIGNGKLEGGVAVPINISVSGGWTVTLGPQLDVLADADGQGRHAGFTGLINIAKQFGKFTLYNEIWTSQNFDPAGTVQQYSYDVSLAWLPKPALQFDIGANVGLNRNTPDLVGYVGISTRF